MCAACWGSDLDGPRASVLRNFEIACHTSAGTSICRGYGAHLADVDLGGPRHAARRVVRIFESGFRYTWRMAGRKRGPEGRGKRVQHTLRTPEEHWSVYEASARAEGYADVNAYIVARLAADHGLSQPAWARPRSDRRDDHGSQQLELAIGA